MKRENQLVFFFLKESDTAYNYSHPPSGKFANQNMTLLNKGLKKHIKRPQTNSQMPGF